MDGGFRNLEFLSKRSDFVGTHSGTIRKQNSKYKENLSGGFAKRLKQTQVKQSKERIVQTAHSPLIKSFGLNIDPKNLFHGLKLKKDIENFLLQLEGNLPIQNICQSFQAAIPDSFFETLINLASCPAEQICKVHLSYLNDTLKIITDSWQIDLIFSKEGNVENIKLLTFNEELFNLCVQNIYKLRRMLGACREVSDADLEIAVNLKSLDKNKTIQSKFYSCPSAALQTIYPFEKQISVLENSQFLNLTV